MKKRSFIRTMNFLMRIQTIAVFIILIIFAVTACYAAQRDIDSVAENFLNIYKTQIDNRIQKINTQLSMIIRENEDMQLLSSEDEQECFYASLRLSEYMKNIMSIDQSADLFVVSEAQQNICLDARADNVRAKDKDHVRDFMKDFANTESGKEKWALQKIGEKTYLYRAISEDQWVAGAVISVDSLMNMISGNDKEKYHFVVTDGNDVVNGYYGAAFPENKRDIDISALESAHLIKNQVSVADGQMKIYLFEDKKNVIHHLYLNAVVLIMIMIQLFVFDLWIMRIEKRQIEDPMDGIVQDMERISKGDYEHRVEERGNNLEFSLLSRTFNHLIDELVNLRIRFYEKQLELSDAEQKYIRLQIRPHFFINALTTISSLSAKGKNREIETYIAALSKNIRYMFRSGLHTVLVKEEIQHVENYFEMQELRYPNVLFYFIDLPQELEEWRIPRMLLHTLVENEYKYAISPDRPLMLLIKFSSVLHGGEEMLLMEVEDDGTGYPEEVLEYMNHDAAAPGQDGSHVGLWSVKRLLELMYDRKDLMEISNVEPHGALNRMYIPKRAVHDRGRLSENLDDGRPQ